MSAFYVGHDHIDALLSAAKTLQIYIYEPGQTRQDAGPARAKDNAQLTDIGRELLRENGLSLAARYPGNWQELVNEQPDDYRYREIVAFEMMPEVKAAADLVRLIDCLDYQSNEHDAWDDSWSRRFLLELMSAAATKAAKAVPESFSCWSYRRPARGETERL